MTSLEISDNSEVSDVKPTSKIKQKFSLISKEISTNFKEQFPYELKALKVLYPWLLLFVFWQLVHLWFHNYIYYLSGVNHVYGGEAGRLHDLGFDLFPDIDTEVFTPSNPVLYVLMAMGFGYMFSILIYKWPQFNGERNQYFISILFRVLLVASVSLTLRVICFMITILPAPAPHCSKAQFDPPTDVGEVFGKFNVNNGCGDLLFSSHMMYGLCATLAITHYTRLKWVIIFAWLCAIALAILIVCQRSHYSIDVFVAWYTVPLVWLFFYHYVPHDPDYRLYDSYVGWRRHCFWKIEDFYETRTRLITNDLEENCVEKN